MTEPPERPGRKPAWLKLTAPAPRQYRATGALLDELDLHTVCREARCPNKGECYASGTATFLILGDVCTRACRFCAVEGEVEAGVRALDEDEPRRVAEAARRLGRRHGPRGGTLPRKAGRAHGRTIFHRRSEKIFVE